MAAYTVASTDRGVYENTLTANTEDIVTLHMPLNRAVEIKVLSGTNPVYVTFDNTAATVKGAHCYDVQPGTVMQAWDLSLPYPAKVRLISASSCVYSVNAVAPGTGS